MTVRYSPTRLRLLGTGAALPGEPVSNKALIAALRQHCGRRLAQRAEKYAKRLGVQSRHVSRELESARSAARPGLDAPQLCKEAVAEALRGQALDYLIGHTSTPHTLLPPNIAWVADGLRYEGPYMELRQACAGFASGLMVAAAMASEDPTAVMGIVGSENGSTFFDIDDDFIDRDQLINFVQMGDGAGAAVVTAAGDAKRGIISDLFVGNLGLDKVPGISLAGAGSAQPDCQHGFPHFVHRAAQVRRHGEKLIEAGVSALEARGYALGDLDWIIPHQASGLIGQMIEAHYPQLRGKVVVTADQLGNLGSAAIWVSFHRLLQSGKVQTGQRVAILGAEASKYLFGGFVYQH